MRKSRLTESQIVAVLKEVEAGVPVAEVVRKAGVSKATFFTWRSKYGGATVRELARLQGTRSREHPTEADVRRTRAGERRDQGCAEPNTVGPSAQRATIALLVDALGLNLPRRTRRRIPQRTRQPLVAPPGLNDSWAIDFMTDTLYNGHRFRTVNVIDEGHREALAFEVSPSLPSVRVIALREDLILPHGTPRAMRCDNGPEFTSSALTTWSQTCGITIQYIQPGKPSQNAFMERFNRTYRHETLDAYVFESLAEVRDLPTDFLVNYNTRRPHDGLGRVPPLTFLPRRTAADSSTYHAST